MLRKIGKAALGKATPAQTLLASTLGGMLGFVPGVFLLGFGGAFAQSPGLLLSLLFAVLVLNANLAIFGVTLVVAKILGLLLLPVSFAVGRLLLDGPTGPLFGALINAPVLAWFGLEHYATTGGLGLGLAFGVALGLGLVRAQRGLRAKLAGLEEDSESYRKWAGKRSVRLAAWLLLGAKRGKKSWREQADDHRKGSPVRILGVAAAVVLGIGLYIGQAFFAGPAFRSMAQSGLQTLNGATVDLARATVDLSGGAIDLGGLAMADPQRLSSNVFDARSLELQIDTANVLRKRLVVARISSREAATGTTRERPGELIRKPTPPPPPPPSEGQEKTLDDYLAQAQLWKDRLARVADVIERLLGRGDEAPAATAEERERALQEQIELLGRARVAAAHLIEGAPMLLVRELVFEGVVSTQLGTKLDIHGANLSTNPRLVKEPMSLSLRSRDERIAIELQAAGGQGLQARLSWRAIPAATVASLLKTSPLRGGFVDLELTGTLDPSRPEGLWLDVPLRVSLRDTTLALPGLPEAKIDALTVPLGLRGPLAAPRIALDDQKLVDALVAAGKKELAAQLRSQLDGALGGKVPGVGGQLGDLIEGKKTPAQLVEEGKKKATDEAKKKAAEELKKVLPGGLFGGKKKGQ